MIDCSDQCTRFIANITGSFADSVCTDLYRGTFTLIIILVSLTSLLVFLQLVQILYLLRVTWVVAIIEGARAEGRAMFHDEDSQ